jgi:hypothetical protein
MMSTFSILKQHQHAALALTFLLFVSAVHAGYVNSILIDFGNNSSYRSTNVVNPGVSNAYWNSLDYGSAATPRSYNNLVYSNSDASTIDITFSNVPPATGWGSGDSYNGPAGTSLDFNTSDVNGNVLGVLGQKAAVFDYYIFGKFILQELDSNTYYGLTFFGSHKYNNASGADDNITVYRVFTNNWGATAYVAAWSNSLTVGVNANNNRDQVAVITNVTPEANNTLRIGFKGAKSNFGYLNCMKIDVFMIPEPAGVLALLVVGWCAGRVLARRTR